MVVSGAQQAFFLCAQLLLDSKVAFWMEEPGYPHARRALSATGARVVPVPVDGEGLVVTSGRDRHAKPRLVYVTPSHQCPTGAAMSAARRLELLEYAGRARAWVIEDDYDSEYRFFSRPLPALQSLDRHNRVIYVGSLSKTMLPCLRVGFIVLPPPLVEPFGRARAVIDRHSPTVEQQALADLIDDGLFERHIRRMRALYLERRGVLVEAIRGELNDAIEVPETDAGLYVLGWLRGGLNEDASFRQLPHGTCASCRSRRSTRDAHAAAGWCSAMARTRRKRSARASGASRKLSMKLEKTVGIRHSRHANA
jgi:GntR family transcriptional regulator/MocR family aminotransferase